MEKQKKIPQLRFPEFEGEWEKNILNDTCTIIGGGTPNSGKEEFWNGHIQWFTPTEIKMDYVSKSERTITELGLKKSSANFLPKGTILLTSRATIGEVAIALNECTTNQGFQSLIVNKLYNNLFIFNWIKNNRYEFVRRANGSTFLEISKSEIGKIPIYIPTLPEQQKIASFFTAIDQNISQLTRKKTLLEQYKKGVMQKIFSQEIRFKDDNGQEFPKWENRKIRELFRVTRGNVLAANNLKLEKELTFCYPVYSSQTTNNGLLGYYSDYLFEDCITWTTDGANAGDVNYRKGKFYCTNVCGVLESKEGFANQCVAEILNSIARKHVAYVGNPKLMNNVMAGIEINIPMSVAEQTKIANFLSAIDVKINHTQKQIEKAEVWKKGLMQQMFV
ncbi:MAG: restriction endonuclease subunit S [Epulopiscium sp.]|nr:restriction endonuclease subunit S [Candidatus Epulonipiscium sp.]